MFYSLEDDPYGSTLKEGRVGHSVSKNYGRSFLLLPKCRL
jgi:hypothetical protein